MEHMELIKCCGHMGCHMGHIASAWRNNTTVYLTSSLAYQYTQLKAILEQPSTAPHDQRFFGGSSGSGSGGNGSRLGTAQP